MLIFVVSRSRLDRYEELRRQFEDWQDVRVILDRREGERREPQGTLAAGDRRRGERRRPLNNQSDLKLGWTVVDTEELVPCTQ
jgi:hypothetical protein